MNGCVIAADMKDPALTAELSQQEDNEEFRERPLDETQSDLGSRERLAKEERLACIRLRQMSPSDRVGSITKKRMIRYVLLRI